MKGEFTIGRIRGIPIKLHWTLILFLPVLAYLLSRQLEAVADLPVLALEPGPLLSMEGRIYAGIVVAIGLFVSVLLHELGHALVALHQGVGVKQITLWIFGGLAQLKNPRRDPRSEMMVAIAGPVVSLGLGLVPFAAFSLFDPGPYVTFPILYLAYLNVILAVFNMVPAFPLDGGRVLRAALGFRMPYDEATDIAAKVGKAMAVLMGLGGLAMGSIWLIAIALFVYMGASQEAKGVHLFGALERVQVRELMDTEVPGVNPETHVAELVPLMLDSKATGFPVLRNDEVVGLVTLEDVREVPEAERNLTRVADVMEREMATVEPWAKASEAMRTMMEENLDRLLVVEHDRLAGIVSRDSLMHAVEILEQMPSRGGGPGATTARGARARETDRSHWNP